MLISILSKNKELAQILKRMDSCTFMPSILLRSGELKQVADAEEKRKAGSVISQEPGRWKSRRPTENVGRMRVKRMYAIFANRQLRQKYFGF